MHVVLPNAPSRGEIDDEEVAAIAGHNAGMRRVPGAWRRTRDGSDEGVAAGGGSSLVDEVLEEIRV
jgi:hypothetical protein